MSVRINLLPHREERRKRARQHFAVLAGLSAVLGIVIVGAIHWVNAARIDAQADRNAFLKSEIAKLDKQIDEIKKLKDEIAALLARKQVIETLQADRAQTVHLLDELV
ncbi:MAG TPA: fimbrial assembly protein, partial [Burkholderiales bacterium]|nr:fimbrial assembly protein [Burkholderiales bacterium]